MKVKHFRAPRVVVATVAQGRKIVRSSWVLFRARKPAALGIFAGALTLGACVWPFDPTLLAALHFWNDAHEKIAYRIAWYLSTWGDYLTYNVPLSLAVWIYGVVTRSSAWRRAAMICFLGATAAGMFNDLFRLSLGRPRPDAHMPDGFYGIAYAMRGGFQSFPSGHAAAVFGTACALLVTEVRLGIVTTIIALSVVWARMELYRHYPSDVTVGTIIGIYFGLLVGLGARVRGVSRAVSRQRD